MSILREFERSIVKSLAADVVDATQLNDVLEHGEFVDLEFTGKGYLLTLRSSELQVGRLVLDRPRTFGRAGDLLTGFVAFVENHELTLECFNYGDGLFPEDYRDLDVAISEQAD